MDHSRTLRNILVVGILSAFAAACAYLLRLYLARVYTVEQYGLAFAMITFFATIIPFVDLGLQQGIIKKASELRAKKDTKSIKRLFLTSLLIQMCIVFIVGIALFIFRGAIAEHFFHTTSTLFFTFMLLWFVTYPIYGLVFPYILTYEKTSLWALFELLRMLFILGCTLLLTYFNVGIISVAIGYSAVNIVLFILFLIINRKLIFPFKEKFDWQIIYPETIKYGLFILASAFAWQIINQTDTLIITFMRGLTSVGLYQAAVPLASILQVAIAPVTVVLLSTVANLWAGKKKKDTVALISLIQKYMLIITLPITVVLVFFSGQALSIIFGGKYIGAEYPLMILSFAYLFAAFSSVLNSVLTATGAAGKVIKIVWIGALLNIIGNYLLIRALGITGAAISVLLVNLMIFIMLNIIMNKNVGTRFPGFVWLKTLFASAIFLAAIIIIKNFLQITYIAQSIISIAGAFIVYLIACYFLGLITSKEYGFLKNIVKGNIRH